MRTLRICAFGFLVVALVLGTVHAEVPAARQGAGGPGWTDLRDAARGLIGFRPARQRPQPLAVLDLPRRDAVPVGRPAAEPKRVRELVERRTANAAFFQLSDGRVQAEVSSTPVHYRDPAGRWTPIDTRVTASSRAGYAFANETNTFASAFGRSSDRLMTFELGGRRVTVGVAGPPRPVAPVASGDTITFPGVFGQGADLRYRVTASGAKAGIVLAAPPALGSARFALTVDARGLTVRGRPDGSIGFYQPDLQGEPLLVMPAPFMYDSGVDRSGPYGAASSGAVSQTLSGEGERLQVVMSADAGWLADPARVYPVVIDPTIKIQPTPTQSQDAMIVSDGPNANYDGSWRLSVGTTDRAKARSLVKFELSSVPPGTRLDSANLQLYFDQDFTTGSFDVPIEARRVTSAWTESTVTWKSINTAIGEVGGNVELVDNADPGKTAIVGEWPAASSQYAAGGGYRYNNNAGTGDTFTWVPRLTESGDYAVEALYVAGSDRATAAPYTVYHQGGAAARTVNQTAGTNGVWAPLGTYPFVAGTSHRVVLGDVANKAVIADAVRYTKPGTAVKRANESSVWHSYSVRSIVQGWLDGANQNYGFMLKAVDEETLGRGGPRYEAAEYAYNGENENTPKLVLTYGKPGVELAAPTKIYSTGAELNWSPYTGSDIVEYQVHRSVFQTFTPSAATLIAPVKPTRTAFTDSTATPTPVDSTDPFGQVYYYMVAVKTTDGSLIPAPTQIVRLPRAGRIVQLVQGDVPDTTLSSTESTTGHDVLAANPWVMVGNNSLTYGTTRVVVRFPSLNLPPGARVLDAEFGLWSVTTIGSGATYTVHASTRTFDEATASWTKADPTTAWSTAGGDYNPTVADIVTGNSNDPAWRLWYVPNIVQGWVSTPTSNHGLLVKLANETTPAERTIFLSSEAPEPQLRPKLVVVYTEPTPVQTYHAPDTPAARMIPGDQYTVPVTINNPTTSTWTATQWELSYRWKLPDGTDVTTGGNQLATPLPSDVAPGQAVTVDAGLKTPIQSDSGNKRREYVLGWELRNKGTGQWLAGIGPLEQPVVVEDPTSNQLGLEKFYSYAGKNTGAGGAVMNNMYAGNAVWTYNVFGNPSRGLSTFLRLAYNSTDTSDTVAGYGWSLQASSLMRLGTPLALHPKPNPTTVTLTDGDGTSHVFSWDGTAGQWRPPAGVHLFLQRLVACGTQTEETRAWLMTRPDRTRFFYDCDGYLSAIEDNNGNTMQFVYEERRSQNKPTKFLRHLIDPSSRQTLTIDYWTKGETYSYIDDTAWTKVTGVANLTNPHIIDHVKQVTDISGRTLTFTYTDKGLLGELVDGAGATDTVEKKFQFRYDMTQGNKNVKLVRVTDPRGNSTLLDYYSRPEDDPKFKWQLRTVTDRLGHTTSFAYTDPDGTAGSKIQTVVTDAESRDTTYVMDGFGRPTETTNAKAQTTKLGWDADNNVVRLEEANGAVSTWAYDPKTGYPTEIKDAEAVRNGWAGTRMTYQTGLNGYIAELIAKRSSEDRLWTFGYNLEGDLTSLTDPVGNSTAGAGDYTTSYGYDEWGQLLTATDANGNTTNNSSFDANGYPQAITDALQQTTRFAYDVRGNVIKVTDALLHDTTQTYDTFGRPLVNRIPFDQAAGLFITTPAPVYDPNDNITAIAAPNGAVSTAVYDAADRLSHSLAPLHKPGDPERRTSYTYNKVGNLLTTTEPNGNATSTAGDFVTTNGYDEIYQLTEIVNAGGDKITYEYDNVGNVITVKDPVKNATVDPNDYAVKYEYDRSHRVTRVIDPLGKFTMPTYDRDGLVTATTDQLGQTTQVTLDKRGKPTEVKVAHTNDGGALIDRITRFEYDEVGNRTKITSPRGVATTNVADDFAESATYDALNRVKETLTAFDPNDARYPTPDKTIYGYDALGRLATLSAPPSSNETVRNDTTYTYWDNGWSKTTTDPWDIVTRYEYNELGGQTRRTLTSAGGSSERVMTWQYYLDGKLKARADDGVPVGKQVVLVDNSDAQNVTSTGTWPTDTSATNTYGHNYATHAAGTGTNTFTWNLNVPQAGSYQVFARYPTVSGAATDAKYTVAHGGGTTVATVDQNANAGTWVLLGSFAFAEGNTHKITLSDQADGTVVADAVKLVRNNLGETDAEKHDYTYVYDPNGNVKTITDASPGAQIDTYAVTYTGLNQIAEVQEKFAGVTQNTTTFTYDKNGAAKTIEHDQSYSVYEYDVRNLLAKVTNGTSATDPDSKVTSYTYTDRGERLHEVKGNGNTVDYTYYLDGLLKTQVEKKSTGVVVAEHANEYDRNGNRTRDVMRKMNADNHSAYLETTAVYSYDPRNRLANVTKTGHGAGTETYIHDANNNVISQTVAGVATSYNYDRNRLLSATTGGVAAAYNYDPFGRLDTITSGGQIIERNVYDGFDHIVENRKRTGSTTSTTRYTFDPFDRTTTKTTDVGTATQKTTRYGYLGLSNEVLDEEVADVVTKSYRHSPWGERLSQVKHNPDGTEEDSFYGYNPHSDVETLTDETGDTKATYGYTAFGTNDETQFTGVDKPDTADPTKEPYNAYRFNAERWDQSSGTYDMGFRDYSPGLNRFLTRDMYNGALADLNLGLNPWTGNRYAFAGGNPITGIELDGHRVIADGGGSAGGTCADEYGYVYPCSQGVGAVTSSTPDDGPPPFDRKTANRVCSQYTQYATCMASMGDPFYGALVAGGPFDPNYRSPIAAFLLELTGIPDAARCAQGSVSGCGWTAAGVASFGLGKLSKAAKLALAARIADRVPLQGASPLDDLADLRRQLEADLGHSDFVLARLDIDGKSYYGINIQHEIVRPDGANFQIMRHAEGHAFGNAMRAGASGGEATLFVDVKVPCQWCRSGFAALGRNLDLDWLTVIGPNGYLGRYVRGGGYETVRMSN